MRVVDPFRYSERDRPPTGQDGAAWGMWALWFVINVGGFVLIVLYLSRAA